MAGRPRVMRGSASKTLRHQSRVFRPEADGRTYFLEVAVAKEVLSGWRSNLDHAPNLEETIERLIYYARYDA